jgi:hypothetical protein
MDNYIWTDVKDGYMITVPELELNLYVLNSKVGWVGIAKYTYQTENKFITSPCETMESAKMKLIHVIVGGLCNVQLKLMGSIPKE